jgi:hypothetical protein
MAAFGVVHFFQGPCLALSQYGIGEFAFSGTEEKDRRDAHIKKKVNHSDALPVGTHCPGKTVYKKIKKGPGRKRPLPVEYLVAFEDQAVKTFYDCRIKAVGPGGIEVLGQLPEGLGKPG